MTTADKSPCKRSIRWADGNRMIEGVARITGEGVYIREKGKRSEYGPVSWGAIFLRGAMLKADETMRDKPKRKKRVSRSLLKL